MRELVWQAEAKRRHDWDQTALLAWLVAEPNRNRDIRFEPFTATTFHPFAEQQAIEEEPVPIIEDLTLLGKLLGGA